MKDNVLTITVLLIILLCAGLVLWFVAVPKISGHEKVDEATAVQIIQNEFPDMKGYPSDQLPQKSIRTERADDGWYVAFIQEGSGRPIISAMCYFVDTSKNIMSIRSYKPEIGDDSPEKFSAKTCTPGACQLETCHGLDISCGPNPPDVCTETYIVGDKCLHYAKCGVKNGICVPVENTSFARCKSCIQNCLNKNKDYAEKLFECESTC